MLFRGVDLLDLWRGRLSLRRLKVLIEQTPGDDPMWAAIDADTERAAARARRAHLLSRQARYTRRKG